MSILVIVESPAKCKKIEHYLNLTENKYKCIASYGHIRELPGLTGINIRNNFAPTFIECEGKKTQIGKIRKAIEAAAEIILASDDDREGEAIAWHLCQVFQLPVETTKRIIFHEITEPALRQAIATPRKINMAVVNAQLARQVLDVLVGYHLSPLLWKHVKDGLSAGRCQTPALRLIYDNQRVIEMTPGKQSYVVTGYFTNKNIPFVLNHPEEGMREFLQASLTHKHVYNPPTLRTKICAAPQPFSTSTLQQAASNELHLSPKDTMSQCQALYEEGYITYHRTDSQQFSEEFKAKAALYILKTYGENYLKGVKDQITMCAHEAIRPTKLECKEVEGKEARLYKLIRRRTLESCMAAASVSVLNASISAPCLAGPSLAGPSKYEYHYSAEQIIFAGWRAVAGASAEASEPEEEAEGAVADNANYTYLQTLKTNVSLPFKKIKASIHLTETKQHYTEAKLVSLLEEKGIGRPSTFASLIDKIQERKYVKKENVQGKRIACTEYTVESGQLQATQVEREFGNEKNKLVITPVGILALEFLLKHFEPFFQYAYTKQMEDDLDLVVQGAIKWPSICEKYYKELEDLSATIAERGKETIRIDADHTYMIGKYGPVIKCVKNKETTFKPVRKDIDLNQLRRGEYTLADVLEPPEIGPISIGLYLEKPVYIKVGKFGKYLEWNGLSKSLKHLKQKPADITLEDVIELLFDAGNEAEQTRVLGPDATIKKGKYGLYIYYQNKKMKKPRFLKLDGFSGGDVLTCDLRIIKEWFAKTYQMEI
jgi:DNA topoisomerase-1